LQRLGCLVEAGGIGHRGPVVTVEATTLPHSREVVDFRHHFFAKVMLSYKNP
jgi:hypothetical protein